MLSLAAVALAAASAASSPLLTSSSPWWEKIVVTTSGPSQQSCRYESSLSGNGAEACDAASARAAARRAAGAYTSITFERRFSPGELPELRPLQAGDKLLGGQIMAVEIDSAGSVRACQVLAASGKLLPDYGCDEARAERFQASARGGKPDSHIGYFTILVYGHAGQIA